MKKYISIIILLLVLIDLLASAQQQSRIFVGPNVMVSSERQYDGTQRELYISAHPDDPKILLASGILCNIIYPSPGQETRAYLSKDGGYNWKTILYPEASIQFLGDPVVGIGLTGTAYFVALGSNKEGKAATLFYRSEDGGTNWDKPLYIPYIDHEQIVIDNNKGSHFSGFIYIAGMYGNAEKIVHGTSDYRIGLLHSSDDGKTWSMVDAADNHDMKDGRGINVASNIPLVFTDGEVFIPFESWRNIPPNLKPEEREAFKREEAKERYQYLFTSSNDGGVTFSPPQRLNIEGGGKIGGGIVPSCAVDNSKGTYENRAYIVWVEKVYDPNFSKKDWPTPEKARILISYSSNRGKTWSKPKMISADPSGKGYQFAPTIAVNNEGTVAVNWYDTRDTTIDSSSVLINQYLSASIDGGETFSPAVRISSKSTDFDALKRNIKVTGNGTGFNFINGLGGYGDYFAMATSSDGTFHPVWLDGRTGSHQIWTAGIRVERTDKTNDVKLLPELVESDVSKQIEVVYGQLRQFPAEGTVEVPIRLKNISKESIYAPLTVEVSEIYLLKPPSFFMKDDKPSESNLLNADNGKLGVGAIFDFTDALGDFKFLAPGAVSGEVILRFKKPRTEKDFPNVTFKVTGRVEEEKK